MDREKPVQRLNRDSRTVRIRAVACACIWLLCNSPVLQAAASTQDSPQHQSTRPASKAYCGLRCLYAAALAEGINFSGADLVKPQYVGSREGSSIEELELAARDHGLHTFAFVNGTVGALRSSTHPTILHVESVPGSGRYDHFDLCLGSRNEKLLVLDTSIDPGEPAQLLSARDVELIWDGSGLLVSKSPIDQRNFAASASQLISWAAGLICLIVVGRPLLADKRISTIRSRCFASGRAGVGAEMLAIATIALAAPAVSAFCAGSGILAHAQQIRMVEQNHIAQFLPRISLVEAKKEMTSGHAVFVDARFAADFSAGHVPGAINVPVTAGTYMTRISMAGVRSDAAIIVYCQSKSCPFSKTVAIHLLQAGYTSVQLMDGGWQEWSAWKQ